MDASLTRLYSWRSQQQPGTIVIIVIIVDILEWPKQSKLLQGALPENKRDTTARLKTEKLQSKNGYAQK